MPTYSVSRLYSSNSGPNADKWRGFVERLRGGLQQVRLTDAQALELNRTGLVNIAKLSDAEPSGADSPGGTLAPDELDALRLGVSQLRTLVDQADTGATLLAMRDTLTEVLPLMERYVG